MRRALVSLCCALACGSDDGGGDSATGDDLGSGASNSDTTRGDDAADSGPADTSGGATDSGDSDTGADDGDTETTTGGGIQPLDPDRYASEIHPIMIEICGECHSPTQGISLTVFPDDPMMTYDLAVLRADENNPPQSQLLTVPLGNGFFDMGDQNDPRYQAMLAWIAGDP